MENLVNWSFWQYFRYFVTKSLSQSLFSILLSWPAWHSLIPMWSLIKSAKNKLREQRPPYELFLLLLFHCINIALKNLALLSSISKSYKKLMPNWNQERRLTRFIRRSIASIHTFKSAAWDLKAIREVTTARAKRASLGGQITQKGGMIKASECRELCSKRKEIKEEQARKRREKKSGQKSTQFLSWLRLSFSLEGSSCRIVF